MNPLSKQYYRIKKKSLRLYSLPIDESANQYKSTYKIFLSTFKLFFKILSFHDSNTGGREAITEAAISARNRKKCLYFMILFAARVSMLSIITCEIKVFATAVEIALNSH